MSDTLDPYHQWLGIKPDEHPLDHYRLLGITPLEENLTAIENAADRQMGHLRKFQTGKHSALSQKLLNEVAAARVCLLSPTKKAAYDAKLREKTRTAAPTASAASSSLDPDFAGFVDSLSKEKQPSLKKPAAKSTERRPRGRKGPSLIGIAVSGLVALLVVLGISVFMRPSAPDSTTKADSAPKPDTSAKADTSPKPGTNSKPDTSAKADTSPKPGTNSKPVLRPPEVRKVIGYNKLDEATSSFQSPPPNPPSVPSPRPVVSIALPSPDVQNPLIANLNEARWESTRPTVRRPSARFASAS